MLTARLLISTRTTCLSVTKTAKSDYPCIGRKRIYSLRWLQFRFVYLGDWVRGWTASPDFGYRRSFQNVSLISTDNHLQRNLNWFSTTTSGNFPYDFLLTTRCCACVGKQPWTVHVLFRAMWHQYLRVDLHVKHMHEKRFIYKLNATILFELRLRGVRPGKTKNRPVLSQKLLSWMNYGIRQLKGS